MKRYSVGIDICSTSAKTVVMDGGEVVARSLQPTGWSSAETAESIRGRLLEMGLDKDNMSCVATGYGRISVPWADRRMTEISCHAMGACRIFGQKDLTVIDIGGQDTKVICVKDGAVRDFIMNDKCSAGTGRFLEVMANTLGVSIKELCAMASEGTGVSISSMCTVFAESEVISLIGRGERRENIAFAVVESVAKKAAVQAEKLGAMQELVCLTGGLCECTYICAALSRQLGKAVVSSEDARYAGALGAAAAASNIKEDRTDGIAGSI